MRDREVPGLDILVLNAGVYVIDKEAGVGGRVEQDCRERAL